MENVIAAAQGSSGSGFAISGWVAIVMAAIGFAGFAGFVLAYLRATTIKNTIEVYKADNDALRGRVETLEGEVKEQQAHANKCEAELQAQRQVNQVLSDQVTGRAAIEELRNLLEAKFSDLIEGQDHMAEALGGLVQDLRKQLGVVNFDRRDQGRGTAPA